jgi:hypothetical protein
VVLRHDVVTMVLFHRCRIDCSHRHAERLRRASRVWCEYDGRSSYSVRLHQTRKQTSAMTIDTGMRSYSNATASSCAYRRPLSLKQARCKWLMEGKPATDMTVFSHTTSHNSPNLASCDIETRGDDRQREDAYTTEYGNGTSGSEYDAPLSDKL